MIKREMGEAQNGAAYLRIEMSGVVTPDQLRSARAPGGLPRLMIADETVRVPTETRRAAAHITWLQGPTAAVTQDPILRAALQHMAPGAGEMLRVFSTEAEAICWLQHQSPLGASTLAVRPARAPRAAAPQLAFAAA
jgi:hypothetical protein